MTDHQALVDKVVAELPAWLPTQRWFAGKDRPISGVRPVISTVLLEGDPLLLHVVVEVEQDDRSQQYQLLIGSRTQLPEHLATSWIGTVGGLLCYEASGDAALTNRLLDLIVDAQQVDGLAFEHEPGIELTGGLRRMWSTASLTSKLGVKAVCPIDKVRNTSLAS